MDAPSPKTALLPAGMDAPKRKRLDGAKRAFRKRWVQVCIVLLVWALALAVTVRQLGPKERPKAGAADTTQYKFIHCDQCKMELAYNKELDGKPCPKCPPPKSGFYVPTVLSVKTGTALSPWAKVYVAWLVETVLMLGVITFLLYRPVVDPTKIYYVVACPHCNQRLRYRAVSHGGLGSCTRCKRMLRSPDEDSAVTEEAVMRADEAAALAEAQVPPPG